MVYILYYKVEISGRIFFYGNFQQLSSLILKYHKHHGILDAETPIVRKNGFNLSVNRLLHVRSKDQSTSLWLYLSRCLTCYVCPPTCLGLWKFSEISGLSTHMDSEIQNLCASRVPNM